MPSHFSWVDFAEEDRQQMLNVVQLFREQDTRDELGIGTIRDAFADYFFPGTSTIQTRVRYMLFIPWIYQGLEQKQVGSDKLARRARDIEIRLIDTLLDSEGKNRGVIGQDARAQLKRLPSSVYWAGLGTWGIRLFSGSQDQYHRYVDTYYVRLRQQRSARREGDQELVTGLTGENWDPGLPGPPPDFPNSCSLTLTPAEARYLQERIYLHHRDTLLAHLVSTPAGASDGTFWNHPVLGQMPADLQKTIRHAQNFSETMYGAALLYNLLLARKSESTDLIDDYYAAFGKWAAQVENQWPEFLTWYNNLPAFWQSPAFAAARIPRLTQLFVEAWLRLLFEDKHSIRLADHSQTEALLTQREMQLKRGRARLQNPRALERWSGASGTIPLEYRWSTAAAFAQEILSSLK